MKKLCLISFFSVCAVIGIAAAPLSFGDFNRKYAEASGLYYQKQYDAALQIMDALVADDFAQTIRPCF